MYKLSNFAFMCLGHCSTTNQEVRPQNLFKRVGLLNLVFEGQFLILPVFSQIFQSSKMHIMPVKLFWNVVNISNISPD